MADAGGGGGGGKKKPRVIDVKQADISEEMQQEAIDVANRTLDKLAEDRLTEHAAAAQMKKYFDKKYGPTWHAVVGRHFGSLVTHESKHFIYFYLDSVAVLLFKCG